VRAANEGQGCKGQTSHELPAESVWPARQDFAWVGQQCAKHTPLVKGWDGFTWGVICYDGPLRRNMRERFNNGC